MPTDVKILITSLYLKRPSGEGIWRLQLSPPRLHLIFAIMLDLYILILYTYNRQLKSVSINLYCGVKGARAPHSWYRHSRSTHFAFHFSQRQPNRMQFSYYSLKPRLHQDTSCIHLLPYCVFYRHQNCCQFVSSLLLDTKRYKSM